MESLFKKSKGEKKRKVYCMTMLSFTEPPYCGMRMPHLMVAEVIFTLEPPFHTQLIAEGD